MTQQELFQETIRVSRLVTDIGSAIQNDFELSDNKLEDLRRSKEFFDEIMQITETSLSELKTKIDTFLNSKISEYGQ